MSGWHIAVAAIFLALILVDYTRYGRAPFWLFDDASNILVRQDFKGALFGGITDLSALPLGMTGLLALLHYATVTKLSPVHRPHRLFWLLSGLGFLWLLGDELLGFHEYLGWRLEQGGFPSPPVGKLKDIAMPGIPAIGGVVTIVALRKALIPHKTRLRFLWVGLGFLAISTAFDVLEPGGRFVRKTIEDGTKVLAGASFFLFYLMAYLDAIGELLRTQRPPW